MRRPPSATRQSGSALLAAVFLIVVVAALGVFATRLVSSQSRIARLHLLQIRGEIAARTGIEYAANRVRTNSANCNNSQFVVDGFTIAVTCTSIQSDTANVFELTSNASSGFYGQPEFVQRSETRRVSTIGSGTW